jgi:Domain of unknown function (DUF3387)
MTSDQQSLPWLLPSEGPPSFRARGPAPRRESQRRARRRRRRACVESVNRELPLDLINAAAELLVLLPRLSGATQRTVRGIAWLAYVGSERGRRHICEPDAISVHHEELEALFGRSFARINEHLGLWDVVAPARKGATHAYRIATDIEEHMNRRLRAANDAGGVAVLVRPNGWVVRKVTPRIIVPRESSCIWRKRDIGLPVPVDLDALALLAWLLDQAAEARGSRRRDLLSALGAEPVSDVAYLRGYLERLRCRARAELPGRGYIAAEYEIADTGRLFEVGLGLQGAPRVIKRYALNGCYAYDIENCHPTIIRDLARHAGARLLTLDDYVENKENRRKELAKRLRLTKRQVKDALIAMTYGSRRRYDGIADAVTAELGPELAAKFWADPYVSELQRDLDWVLAKGAGGSARSGEDLDQAIRQIVSKAIASDQIVDIFSAAGLKKPDISILSDEFLAEVAHMPQRNLAVDLLEKLLKGEIKVRAKRNVVQARSFSELLEQSVRRYQNRAIETAQVIEELIKLAKDMRAAAKRGEELNLSDDELAFYEALEVNDSAVKVLGEPTLVTIARELVETVKRNVTIDWTLRENVKAHLRVIVKRILRKYGYPPDKQEKATQLVLEQAEVLSEGWA